MRFCSLLPLFALLAPVALPSQTTAALCASSARISCRVVASADVAMVRNSELQGWTLLEAGRSGEALQAFRQAARVDPSRGSIDEGIGTALSRLDRNEEALRAFREAARVEPFRAILWGEMARSARRLGRHQEAISYWERALRLAPDYFDAREDERHDWEQAVAAEGPQPPALPEGVLIETLQRDTTSRNLSMGAGPTSSGSGFFVAHDVVITNKHVVRGCSTLRVRSDSGRSFKAEVSIADPTVDLALLTIEGDAPAIATFRAGAPPRPGEDVVAVGYPLSGLLADQVNVSTGSINALAGMYNDDRILQMSAPVQPGSSGGPLFDASGNVIGIVVTKLNAKVVAEAMGDIPQNVNFALKGSVARAFLDANRIAYTESPSLTPRSHADVGDIGRKVTVLVECWK
jgi:S1-C subfamily serine protease